MQFLHSINLKTNLQNILLTGFAIILIQQNKTKNNRIFKKIRIFKKNKIMKINKKQKNNLK